MSEANSIPIDYLEEGMTVAEDVMTESGQLILPAESSITSRHIDMLRQWDIPSVKILDEASTDKGPTPEEILKKLSPQQRIELDTEMERLFRFQELDDPFVKELHNVAITRKLKKFR